jgi:VWFA-related protein
MVRNNKSKPVLDLKPADIAVTDGGVAVKLSDLRLVTSGDHLVTLVFDRLGPSSANNAKEIAAKILKAMPASGFSFSVLGIDGRLRMYQGFTSDRAAIGKAVGVACERSEARSDDAEVPEKNLIATAQLGTNPSAGRVSAQERQVAQVMLETLEESQKIEQDQRVQPALAGLLALARMQRQISGRKVVIYFAQGLQTDVNSGDMLRSIVGAANRSGVSIYAVDANALSPEADQGLVAMMAMGGARAATAQGAGSSSATSGSGTSLQPTPQLPGGMQTQISDTFKKFEGGDPSDKGGPLEQLALSTGGAYVAATDSLKKPLHQLIEDMTTYYEVSYAPPIQEYDGRFRPVAIKPVRKGLKIRARAGYFALPPSTISAGIQPFEAPLMKTLGETQLPSDVKFRTAVIKLGDLPDGNANALMVEVPISELEVRQDANAGLFSLHVSIVAQIKDKTGTVIEHFAEDVPRHGALEGIEGARSDVVTLQRHFIAPPGNYVMEIAVLDRNSEKVSAQRTSFAIETTPSGPALSDLALVRKTDHIGAESDLLEPLRYENGRVVPSLSGRVPRDAKSIPLFFIVHPAPQGLEQPRLEMEVFRNGEPVGSVPLQLGKSSGHGAIPYMASMQAKSLPAGDYEAVATLSQDGKSAVRSVSFRVEGPELASAGAMAGTGIDAGSGDDASPDSKLTGVETKTKHALVITALPDSALQPPDAETLQALIADARQRALGYARSLPNFMCIEVTDRSVDAAGNGRWRRKDSISELLRYLNNAETRTTLEVNGKASTLTRTDLRGTSGTLSQGEFGGVLNAVFQTSSKTEFQWKESASIGNETVQVLSYRVARTNSSWGLEGDDNWKDHPGFHGLLYIDAATRGVRRITLQADDLPRDFSIHTASMTVDYDYIAIGTHDYLMPIRASMSLTRGKRTAVLNDMEFRNYRRYGSGVKILYGGEVLK